MRLKLTVPCLLILNCLCSFSSSTALAQQDDTRSRAVKAADASAVSSDVMAVVKAYTDAVCSRKTG